MNHNKSNTLVTALMGLVMGSTAHAACTVATATPFQAGPPNPNNGFAEYVRDSSGLALELCLSPSAANDRSSHRGGNIAGGHATVLLLRSTRSGQCLLQPDRLRR